METSKNILTYDSPNDITSVDICNNPNYSIRTALGCVGTELGEDCFITILE